MILRISVLDVRLPRELLHDVAYLSFVPLVRSCGVFT